MNTERVLDITQNEKGQLYAMAQRRQQYVTYLQEHEHDSQMSTRHQTKLLEWTKNRMTFQV